MNIYTSKTEFLEAENKRLHALNQELLEALKSADWYIGQLEAIAYDEDDVATHETVTKVQAAIAKATGEQK